MSLEFELIENVDCGAGYPGYRQRYRVTNPEQPGEIEVVGPNRIGPTIEYKVYPEWAYGFTANELWKRARSSL